jgi:hypothetical protein
VIEIPPITPVVIEHRLHSLPAAPQAPAQNGRRMWSPAATGPGSVHWWVCWVVLSL